ncbi:MAG: hypothetical protein CMJ52_03935 [Planctomycetaceae bacterium]|nr:hypothetical protein [Planctomycetaceae bacterium]
MPTLVLLAQIATSCMLTGLIWTIQVVHYPLFASVGADRFAEYEASHSRLITLVVGPLMLAEAATAIAFLAIRPPSVPMWIPLAGAALLAVVWLTTAFVSVPCHARLADGFDVEAHRRLVDTNWIRTAAWSARAAVLLLAGWLALNAVRGDG